MGLIIGDSVHKTDVREQVAVFVWIFKMFSKRGFSKISSHLKSKHAEKRIIKHTFQS